MSNVLTKINKNVLFLLIITLVFGFMLIVRFTSPEDTWLCKNGEWIKHGNPRSAQPTELCVQENAQIDRNLSAKKESLENQQLRSVPDSVIKNSELTELSLANNFLESLPSQIENWKNLEVFNVENNRIKSLPAEIRHFQKLRILDASNNGMTNIPAEIGQLKNLQEIDFSNNSLTEFPNEILKLTQLKKLDLRNNSINPEHLTNLKENLKQTEILY